MGGLGPLLAQSGRSWTYPLPAAELTCRTGALRSRDLNASSAPFSDRAHAAYLASVRTGG